MEKSFIVFYKYDGRCMWKEVSAKSSFEAIRSFLDEIQGQYLVEIESCQRA